MFKKLKKKGTVNAYAPYEKKFRKFCKDNSFSCVPAAPDTVIAFMKFMLDEGYARSTICSSAMGAITAMHIERDVSSPTTHPRVMQMKNIIKSHTPAPRSKKPMTHETLEKFILLMDVESKLDTRDLFPFELMLAALLRESEAMNLLLDDVQVMTIDGQKVLVVFVETSKTDQGGSGDCIIVAENPSQPLRCVVSWFLRYLEFRGDHTSPFLFVAAHDGMRREKATGSMLNEALPKYEAQSLVPQSSARRVTMVLTQHEAWRRHGSCGRRGL